MASYQVFIPNVTGARESHLSDVGLHDLMGEGATVADVQKGPDGHRGICVYWVNHNEQWRNPQHLGFHAASQAWSPAKKRGELEAGRFWLGRDVGRAVEPADILKRNYLGGGLVKLSDGQEWLVPVARSLPRGYRLDEDGVQRLQTAKPYQAFYDQAEHYFNVLMNAKQGQDVPLGDAFSFAAEALAFNYRINLDVIDWLGDQLPDGFLIGELQMIHLIGQTFEFREIAELAGQKKTEDFGTHAT